MPGTHKYSNIRTLNFTLLLTVSLLCLVIIQPTVALVLLPDGTEVPKDQIQDVFADTPRNISPEPMQFFYDYDCQSCQQVLDYLKSFEKKNPEIGITHYNLAYPKENNILFNQQKGRYNTTKIHYPAVFIGDVSISGSSDIIHYTEPVAKGY